MKRLFILIFFMTLIFIQSCDNKNQSAPVKEKDGPVSKETLISARELRERLLSDPYRPAYHFCIPEGNGRPGDPNGAFFHKGRYHLMYLYERTGTGFAWGHISSPDLINWRHQPDAIVPGEGDEGCFSGGAFVDEDGSAVLSYWMLWGDKGIGLAKSTDPEFNSWKKSEANPVIKSTEWGITAMKDETGKDFYVGSADPSNIWKKDGKYYILTGNLLVLRKFGSRGTGLPANFDNGPVLPADSLNYQGDRLYLFRSNDLKTWNYMHEFYNSDRKWTSKTEDNMCPGFLPLPGDAEGGENSGKYLLLFISHNMGCQYYVGDYKDDHFIPLNHGRMSWNDNAYFAPEALVDGKGRQIMWSWIFDDRPDSVINQYGWTGTYGLPRTLWLGKDNTLRMRPVKELEKLRMEELAIPAVTLLDGKPYSIPYDGSELQEIEVSFTPGKYAQCGIKVCASPDGREETVIFYDASDSKLKFDTRKSGLSFGRKIIEEAPLELTPGEPLTLRIFIDRSIIEVFANDRQAIARMVYPTLGGRGISLFSNGGNAVVKSFKFWELSPSNPY